MNNAETAVKPIHKPYWCAEHRAEMHCTRYSGCKTVRWSLNGAAGVLFFHRASGTFLLNLRSAFINNGGTWSTIGGALDAEDESAFVGAMREVEEEIGEIPVDYAPIVVHEDVTAGEFSDWTYTTYIVEVAERWEAENADAYESDASEWVDLQTMSRLPLHPSFRKALPALLKTMYYEGAFNG